MQISTAEFNLNYKYFRNIKGKMFGFQINKLKMFRLNGKIIGPLTLIFKLIIRKIMHTCVFLQHIFK